MRPAGISALSHSLAAQPPVAQLRWRSSGGAAEVFRGNRVEELPELLDLVLLLVRDRDPRLVEYLLAREDRGAGAQREGDGVRRPGADFLAIRENKVSEEDPVPQRGDVDRPQ